MKRFTVIGINDEVQKYHGPAQRFAAADVFSADTLPDDATLRAYAEHRGHVIATSARKRGGRASAKSNEGTGRQP